MNYTAPNTPLSWHLTIVRYNEVIGLHVNKGAVYVVRSGSIGVLRVCDDVESSSFALSALVGSIERDVESLWSCCQMVLEKVHLKVWPIFRTPSANYNI